MNTSVNNIPHAVGRESDFSAQRNCAFSTNPTRWWRRPGQPLDRPFRTKLIGSWLDWLAEHRSKLSTRSKNILPGAPVRPEKPV
jgi:hypothetical protein